VRFYQDLGEFDRGVEFDGIIEVIVRFNRVPSTDEWPEILICSSEGSVSMSSLTRPHENAERIKDS
jgi:hypothetical protein